MAVAEHLHLDMARAEDVFLDQHVRVAKRCRRLALAGGEGLGEILRAFDQPHALAAAAGHRLDEDRPADVGRLRRQMRGVLILAEVAGGGGHAGGLHQPLGRILQAHRGDRGRRRPHPDQPGIDHALGKGGVFREEAIARMDRLRPGGAGGGDDPGAIEIALARRGGADVHGLIRHAHMQCLRIGIGIDRDGADTHCPRGADHAAGDLATVGDEEGLDHGCLHHIRNTPKSARAAIGVSRQASSARPSTSRVCTGSITPSSHRRAVA